MTLRESGQKENDTYKKSTVSSDSPTPPKKWNDWSHVIADVAQGRMF